MQKLESDKWYFTVECAKCHEPMAFLQAPSPDELLRPKQRSADLICPFCGHQQLYTPEQMYVAQGPEK